MKNLKFRAWDKENKKMITHNELFNMDCSNEYPFLALIAGHYERLNVDIMQFTGLQDKNGNDIYEGDIIKVINETHENELFNFKPRNGLVIFCEGEFCFIFEGYYWRLNFEDIESIEIIGNEFQSPELLEVK